ncbi:type VI secretion system baseplate subunit TssE [Niveispirillum fermenti]|uniref:type VI secretion system baseplate subunit TssE n=1 Tax=Niveispirillum fermenti TaxID=1233113 RepID=UPI003A89ADD1
MWRDTPNGYQPSLRHRLSGRDRPARARSLEAWRQELVADLAILLQTTAGGTVPAGSMAAGSVLGYGLPAFAGMAVTDNTILAVQGALQAALETFEPRIVPGTIRVRFDGPANDQPAGQMAFTVECTVEAVPARLQVTLNTIVDFTAGTVGNIPQDQRHR